MQQHIYYTKYALRFADMQIPELVTVFNHLVGNTCWTGMRSYHDQALIDEFQRRGIDVSAIYDGKTISFARPVRYDIADKMKGLGYVLCGCGIIGAMLFLISNLLIDKLKNDWFWNATGFGLVFMVVGLIFIAFALIFETGCKLQQESDETL